MRNKFEVGDIVVRTTQTFEGTPSVGYIDEVSSVSTCGYCIGLKNFEYGNIQSPFKASHFQLIADNLVKFSANFIDAACAFFDSTTYEPIEGVKTIGSQYVGFRTKQKDIIALDSSNCFVQIKPKIIDYYDGWHYPYEYPKGDNPKLLILVRDSKAFSEPRMEIGVFKKDIKQYVVGNLHVTGAVLGWSYLPSTPARFLK